MRHHFLLRFAAGLLALGLVPPALAQDACIWTEPKHLPVWSLSGAWDGDEVVFVDAREHELLRYNPRDGYVGTMNELARSVHSFAPDALRPNGDGGFLLQNGGAFFTRLTPAMRPGPEERVEGRAVGAARAGEDNGKPIVDSVFSWQPAAGGIIACSDVRHGNNWRHGYVRVPADASRGVEFLQEITRDDPIRVYCRLGLDLIATEGTTAWVLMMQERPQIVRFDEGRVLGDPLPTDLGTRPDIAFVEMRDAQQVMAALEASALPVGLYPAGDRQVVVLSRRPAEAGKTEWRLTRVNGKSGEILGVGILPTTANHLTVVPGSDYWALLERGRVRAMGDHEAVFGIRYVPTRQIENLTSNPGKLHRICG